MSVTNYGYFGSQLENSFLDPETGTIAPSCQFPAGSDIEYLFQGALWVGAIVDEDTLVSVGTDGWQHIKEMYPDSGQSGAIQKRSNRRTDAAYSEDAISVADYISVYSDTLTDPQYVPADDMDKRPHEPLNLKVIQKSYSWDYSYAEDFILYDFDLVNIGQKRLNKLWMGIYIDADVLYRTYSDNEGGFDDDICGFRETVPNPSGDFEDTIRVAWIADNDGDPEGGSFTRESPLGVTGTRVVRTPNPDLRYSFNWWVSEQDQPNKYDWGPMKEENERSFGTGGLGTPEGDKNKYYLLSNNEFDYDQIYTGVDYTEQGWLPPPANELVRRIAAGYDTRYLISFGPFNLDPGDTLPVTLAYVAGDNFHVKPDDFDSYDVNDPDIFYEKLDFTDFAVNATWAAWVYDNPGVDTDGDNDSGKYYERLDDDGNVIERIYYAGDGVPDWEGPPPPPPPILRYSTVPGEVTIRWNGLETETYEDLFSQKQDFEGYRVYMGKTLNRNEFALLTSHDLVDFSRYWYDPAKDRWFLTEIPFSPDSLKTLYGENFDPEQYDDSTTAFTDPQNGEEMFFVPVDFNRYFSDPRGLEKSYMDEIQAGTITKDTGRADFPDNYVEIDGEWYHKYYEYEYTIEGLLSSQAFYFAVTAFDYGNPENNLEPLESSQLGNATLVYPIYSADQVEEEDASVSVYPNPYRGDAGYYDDGYEPGDGVYDKRIHFVNLPAECTIKIWTTDGDLVREIEHPGRLSETDSKIYWDLITRNTQAVVSGIYIYSIESDQGTQTGKIVIIL
ncbi:MAG: hypothetical protein GF404_07010 [candidate division Zixibacteria bacterium]|nr:hypothetical protein [candidate division Zixibacteria bacterium]